MEDRMSRIRTALVAVPLAAFALIAGAGAAAADNGAFAGEGSSSSVVSNVGSGNVSGWVDGNTTWTQQTATGAGATNSNNTLSVKDNSGAIWANQVNHTVTLNF
jgi:hypothetical protein